LEFKEWNLEEGFVPKVEPKTFCWG